MTFLIWGKFGQSAFYVPRFSQISTFDFLIILYTSREITIFDFLTVKNCYYGDYYGDGRLPANGIFLLSDRLPGNDFFLTF